MRSLLMSEKLRFVLVGCFNTGLDFLLLNFFVLMFGLSPVAANTISVVICITFSYILNHKFVFRSEEPLNLKKYASFFLVTGFSSLILQDIIIYGFSALMNSDFGRSLLIVGQLGENRHVELNVAKAAAVAIGMIWNYLLYKHIIFKHSKPNEEEVIAV